jgi:hypothetical protein
LSVEVAKMRSERIAQIGPPALTWWPPVSRSVRTT